MKNVELLKAAKEIQEVCKNNNKNCTKCPFFISETEELSETCIFWFDEPSLWEFE